MADTYKGIKTERQGQALCVTMSNPGKKNAITSEMYSGLAHALTTAAEDPEVRVVWLRGEDGVFTSGNDLSDFTQVKMDENPPVIQFLKAIITFPKPIVAQVEGVAVGVGVTLLMHCDLIYAAEDARFQLPFVNLGLVPEAGASYVLPQLMGQARAAELLLLGQMFDAQKACEVGLVSAVVPASDVAAKAEAAVTQLCAQPPKAVQKSKALLRKPLAGDLWARVEEEARDFAAGLKGEEFMEAFTAFVQKRAPVFK